MAVTPLKVFLFLFGCTAAAGGVAYGTGALDPLLGRTPANPAAVAALPEPPPSDPAAPKGERVNEPPANPGTDAAAQPPAPATAPPATAAEPPAEPGTMMAAVPPSDEAAQPPAMAAQPPADQAATPPAGTPPAGPQPPTFDVVRVEADGSLVVAGKAIADALVELLDGEAVLGSDKATPEGDFAIVLDERLKPGDYQLTLRATPPGGTAIASLQTAVLSVPDQPGGQVLAMVEQPGQASDILTVPQPEPPASPGKPADVAANPPSDQPNPADAAGQEEKPADVASAPADANPPKAGEAANEQKPGDEAAAPAKPAEVAAAPAQPAEQAPPDAKVAVEAVEIDGGKIFVAGIGDPGRFVRVYANEIVLGETRVSEGGRFLIEAKRDLPVGKYIIRADLLDADGVKVVARATVPFEREPGESIAAVAPVEPPADKPAEVAAAKQPPAAAEKPPAGNQGETPPATAAEAVAPQPEQPATAGETSPPADSSPKPEQPAVAANEPPPADSSPQPEQPAVAANEPPPADGAAADKPAGQPPAVAAAEPPAIGDAAPPETMSPKLEKVEGAVIIRRSDTLWRISRRVYGRGIRYWTIYLANQNQISNPDKIWPGQVFRVPDKSKEGEAADMSAMGSQVTTVTPQ